MLYLLVEREQIIKYLPPLPSQFGPPPPVAVLGLILSSQYYVYFSRVVQTRDNDEALTAYGKRHACLARLTAAEHAQVDQRSTPAGGPRATGTSATVVLVDHLEQHGVERLRVSWIYDAHERPPDDGFRCQLQPLVEVFAGEAGRINFCRLRVGWGGQGGRVAGLANTPNTAGSTKNTDIPGTVIARDKNELFGDSVCDMRVKAIAAANC